MKRLNSFSILFTLILLLLTSSLAAAAFTPEAGEIPYQINNSDRIVIGTVSKIDVCDYYTNNTVTIKEWLYNPLPEKTIVVRTTLWAEDARFTQNESVLLMLSDQRPNKGVFNIPLGELGKHPASDRDAVMKALKAQGKIEIENQSSNETVVAHTNEITATQKPTSNPQLLEEREKENTTKNKTENTTVYVDKAPFISPAWAVAIMLIAIICSRRQK